MGFLIFMAALMFFVFLLPKPSSQYTGKPKKNWCPPHVWIYDETGFLICDVCHNRPGYQGRE